MNDSFGSILSPERLREKALAALVPFFLGSPTGDAVAARLAAASLLDGYKAATPKEMQLATEIVAFDWTALACLGASATATHLSLDLMLDLQDSAIAHSRLAQKASRALLARRKERARNPNSMPPENTRWDEGAFELAINRALEKLTDANARLAAFMAKVAPVAPVAKVEAVEPKTKLPIYFAEQMTPAVLARRARH